MGIAIQCDKCGATWFGGNGSTVPGPIMPKGYHWSDGRIFKDAESIGWTIGATFEERLRVQPPYFDLPPDLCPACTVEVKSSPNPEKENNASPD